VTSLRALLRTDRTLELTKAIDTGVEDSQRTTAGTDLEGDRLLQLTAQCHDLHLEGKEPVDLLEVSRIRPIPVQTSCGVGNMTPVQASRGHPVSGPGGRTDGFRLGSDVSAKPDRPVARPDRGSVRP
jgi:hypothetical protein